MAPLRARNTSTAGGLFVSCFSIRSPSTITMAFVQSLPLASQSFPKRTALTVLALGLSCAQFPPRHDAPRTAARRILIGFMEHSPLQLRTRAVQCLTSNSVLNGMQSRRTADYRWRRAVSEGVVFCREEELMGGMGGATPAV